MHIFVSVKHIGKRINVVKPVDFIIDCVPATVGELIRASVRTCVREYNKRIECKGNGDIMDKDTESALARAGKIAFGLTFSDKEADMDKAIKTAMQGYRDGLFRVFLGEQELSDENESISVTEQSEITFIRLTMLAGRMW